jgi:hypothetical protein
VLGLVLLVSLTVLAFAGVETARRFLVLTVSAFVGAGVGHLAGRPMRGHSPAEQAHCGLAGFSASISVVAPIVLLLGGSPTSPNALGAAEFSAFLGYTMAFWYAVLPFVSEVAGNEGVRRGFLRFGLQASGVVVGSVLGLVLTIYVVGPLSQRIS